MAKEEKHQPAKELPPVPGWLRRDPATDAAEAAFRAGAALALLDARVRADVPFAGVWRRRLALSAAAASSKMIRRGEDIDQLRDAFFLRVSPSDEPGPAGRLLIAWRALDRSAPLSDDAVHHVTSILDLKTDDALRIAVATAQADAQSNKPAPIAAAETARAMFKQRPDAELLGLWLADGVLATHLKWPMPLSLLAGGLMHPALRLNGRRPYPADDTWATACCVAYAVAALQACDLFADLARRSDKLIAVAPRLRAKGAAAVVQNLLADDAVPSTKQMTAISDRGLRRLFERLVALGAVRELTRAAAPARMDDADRGRHLCFRQAGHARDLGPADRQRLRARSADCRHPRRTRRAAL